MRNLQGKVAVVTGAAEGIGRAIAVRAGGEGMKLVLADRNAEKLADTAGELASQGFEVASLKTDVSREDQVEALAAFAYERFGAVHLLVNNAGVALGKPSWETTQRDWDWVMGVNLYGVTNGLRSFVPRMLAKGEDGHIVNVASLAGLVPEPGLAAYNASKFAVVAVTEGLHHDLTLRGSKIKVSVLCPGWVKTRIGESERHRAPDEQTDASRLDEVMAKTSAAMSEAVNKGISPEEVADRVFAAIAAGDFYILTHENAKVAIGIRMQDILQNRQPTLLPI